MNWIIGTETIETWASAAFVLGLNATFLAVIATPYAS